MLFKLETFLLPGFCSFNTSKYDFRSFWSSSATKLLKVSSVNTTTVSTGTTVTAGTLVTSATTVTLVTTVTRATTVTTAKTVTPATAATLLTTVTIVTTGQQGQQ